MFPNRHRINSWLLWPVRNHDNTHKKLGAGIALALSVLTEPVVLAHTHASLGVALWLLASLITYLGVYYLALLVFAALTETATEPAGAEGKGGSDYGQGGVGIRLIRIIACGGLTLVCLAATIGNVHALYDSADVPSLLGAIAGTASLTIIGATGTISLNLVGRRHLMLFLIGGNAACCLLAVVSFALQPTFPAALVASWCALLIAVLLLRAKYWWNGSPTS